LFILRSCFWFFSGSNYNTWQAEKQAGTGRLTAKKGFFFEKNILFLRKKRFLPLFFCRLWAIITGCKKFKEIKT